ncbi:hypothetical protein [Ottowia sp.]|uniref:hypothetical protein n=1 Tax=Ottowia sp. TaxID=1898956 RepID=UPI003A8A7F44
MTSDTTAPPVSNVRQRLARAAGLGFAAVALAALVGTPARADTGTCVGTNVTDWSSLMTAYNGAATDLTFCLVAGAYTAGAGEYLLTPAGRSLTIDLNGQSVSITNPPIYSAAIGVGATETLTIVDSSAGGSGTVEARGGDQGAGIGGGSSGAGGTVEVRGGTVTATGGQFGAGIGGGWDGDGATVTLGGGVISATGSAEDASASYSGGAAIGSGGTSSSTAPAAGTLTFGANAPNPVPTFPSSYASSSTGAPASVPTPVSTGGATDWSLTANNGTPTTASGQSHVTIVFRSTSAVAVPTLGQWSLWLLAAMWGLRQSRA